MNSVCVSECFGASQACLMVTLLVEKCLQSIGRYKLPGTRYCQCRKICSMVQMDFSSCKNAMVSAGMCQLLQLSEQG